MAEFQPIMATRNTAAKLLDMTPREFDRLTEAGTLPRGREIAPGIVRWDVQELRRMARGDLIEGMGDVDWSA